MQIEQPQWYEFLLK